MRICLVASSRHPIREPFAGGLESLTHVLARELSRRGHDVSLFAAPGSDPGLPVRLLEGATFTPSAVARADRNAPSAVWMEEHHAYLALMMDLASGAAGPFDVVHNNSLHHLPVAMAGTVGVPVVTTLHTPPLPWLESAIALAPHGSSFTAVSAFTRAQWAHATDSTVVRNGVDLAVWRPGCGGGPAVWSGRLVPEKAPHEAIDACRRAGRPLLLTGPAHDAAYFREQIRPRLGSGVRYLGHLGHRALRSVLGRAAVAIVTPAWDEPYGLVAAEAMACGTPVAAYARGAMAEIVGPAGVLVAGGDVDQLAAALGPAARVDRAEVRSHAERTCSLERMVDGYEQAYRVATRREQAA